MAALLWRWPTSGPWGSQRGPRLQLSGSMIATYSGLWLVLARQLLQVSILVVGWVCGHVEVGVAVLVAWVVMASVMIKAPGRKDRGADSERQPVLVVALSRNSIVALV